VSVLVELPGPIDIPASLESFRRNGDDGIDRWDGHRLVRTVRLGERSVAYAAAARGDLERPAFEVETEDPAAREAVEQAVRAQFLTPPPDFGSLLERDPIVAELNARLPGLRPVLQPDLLTALIRSISAQQVNLRWAATTRRRLAERFGVRHQVAGTDVFSFDARRLAAAEVQEIRDLQFTTRKAEYIIGVAEAIASGRLTREELEMIPDEQVVARLTALRGIGRWTAEWIMARTLGRPVVVAGDLGVRKVIGAAYLGEPLPPEDEVRRVTVHWGDSSPIAQSLLLHSAYGVGGL
jgi:DNA-3-methyladenine glycosylase II